MAPTDRTSGLRHLDTSGHDFDGSTYVQFAETVQPVLLRVAASIALDREEAADLVQDALEQAFKS